MNTLIVSFILWNSSSPLGKDMNWWRIWKQLYFKIKYDQFGKMTEIQYIFKVSAIFLNFWNIKKRSKIIISVSLPWHQDLIRYQDCTVQIIGIQFFLVTFYSRYKCVSDPCLKVQENLSENKRYLDLKRTFCNCRFP